jgi:hypothetical protein
LLYFHALLQIRGNRSLIHRLLPRTIYLLIANMRVIYRENIRFFRDRSLSWVSLAPISLTIRAMDKWWSRECFLLLKLNILKRHFYSIFILIDTVLFDEILCPKEPSEAFFKDEWVFALIEDSFNELFSLFNELEILELESCVSYY